jgi:hypothetical protein
MLMIVSKLELFVNFFVDFFLKCTILLRNYKKFTVFSCFSVSYAVFYTICC